MITTRESAPPPGNPLIEPVRVAVTLFAFVTTAGLPLTAYFQASGAAQRLSLDKIGLGYVAAAAILGALYALRNHLANLARWALVRLGSLRGAAAPVAVGLVLRTLWFAVFPGVLTNDDGATYASLAEKLVNGAPYVTAGYKAFWPPGYPLFLTPLAATVGINRVTLLLLALALFVAGALGLRALCTSLRVPRAGTVAMWLLALWPNLIAATGLPDKETITVAALPWVVAWTASAESPRWTRIGATGLLFGVCLLTQPSLLFFPAVLLATRWILGGGVAPVAAITALALCVVAPWTLRNQRELGKAVLISTNGGSVLYRANNEIATGAYLLKGPRDFSHLPEIEWDRASRNAAIEWILANPGGFVHLALAKQLLLMGDDSTGVYMARNAASMPSIVYHPLKALATLCWFGLWCALFVFVFARRIDSDSARAAAVCLLPMTYLFGIHSIFESGSRYHTPAIPFVLAAAAIVFVAAGAELRQRPS